MNRTQKKCLLASAALHLLLIALLALGPAFRSPDRVEPARPLIDFVPLKTIDEALAGGGNPQAPPAQPAPPPQPPQPRPTPQPLARPAPLSSPPAPRQPAPEPESFRIEPTRKAPDIKLTPVVRKPDTTSPTASSSRPSRETPSELARAARAAARRLQQDLSPATTVELRGHGGGGVPYANFLDAVRKVYSDAWIVPDGVSDDEATATASVTIARDGRVVSARLVRSSGNGLVDASVEAVLRRVTYVAPLPETAPESERTVTIRFNVKAKRALG